MSNILQFPASTSTGQPAPLYTRYMEEQVRTLKEEKALLIEQNALLELKLENVRSANRHLVADKVRWWQFWK